MRRLFISLLMLLLNLSGFTVAQYKYQQVQMPEPSTTYPLKNPGTLCYLELGGSGGILSVNYEKYLSETISIRGGFTALIGAIAIVNYNLPHAPVEVGLGCGTSFLLMDGKNNPVLFTPVVGFKRISAGGFVFRVTIAPIIGLKDKPVIVLPGISFGWRM